MSPHHNHLPVSVIVLTKNRHAMLSECLASLGRQTHMPGEIIIVDGSDTPFLTRRITEKTGLSVPVRIYTERNGSIGYARNLGIHAARYMYVIFLDDDLVAPPSLLARYVRDFRRYPHIDGVVGRTENTLLYNPYAVTYAAYYARGLRNAYGHIRTPTELTWGRMVDAEVTALRTKTAKRHGFRLTHRGAIDDVEFGVRLTREGIRFLYDPAIVAFSASRGSFSHLFWMVLREGYYDAMVERQYGVNVSLAPKRIPFLPWFTRTVRSAPFRGLQALWFMVLLILYPVMMRMGKAWFFLTHI